MEIIEGIPGKGRSTSSISFPYSDIGDAIRVAEGLLKGGGTALSRDQLAAAMGQTPTSGSFNTKVNTARIFGVMDTTGGKYTLTDLGFEIVDSSRQREAMIRAFMNVDLYKKVYDEFKGKRLPPRPHGLERAFATFGVAPKQTKNARLAFEKSARAAGFYPGGDEDRLVMPFGQNLPAIVSDEVDSEYSEIEDEPSRRGGVVRLDQPDIHPSILGMLDELPPPKTDWSIREQAAWLQALATLFPVIYKAKEDATLSIKVLRQIAPKEPGE